MSDAEMARTEFEYRVHLLAMKFVDTFSQNREKMSTSSVRDFQTEMAICLAIQLFVKKIKAYYYEVDRIADVAILHFTIVPASDLLKGCEPYEYKLNLENTSAMFGKGFHGENNPFWEINGND